MRCCSTVSRSLLVTAIAAAAGAGFVVGSSSSISVAAQAASDDQPVDGAMQGMAPEMMEMMQRYMEYSELRPEHREMHDTAGTWLVQSSWWMDPAAPPQEQTMMADIRPMMGGRFMIEEMSGLMDGPEGPMPWKGMAISGYDNRVGKHSFVWVDSAGTMMTTGYGTRTADDEWTYEYTAYDPKFDAIVERKNIVTKKNADEHTFEMHTKEPGGSWFKNMSMTYTRAQ